MFSPKRPSNSCVKAKPVQYAPKNQPAEIVEEHKLTPMPRPPRERPSTMEVLTHSVKLPEPKPPKQPKVYLPGERLLKQIAKTAKAEPAKKKPAKKKGDYEDYLTWSDESD
jgi:hypothetical protein